MWPISFAWLNLVLSKLLSLRGALWLIKTATRSHPTQDPLCSNEHQRTIHTGLPLAARKLSLDWREDTRKDTRRNLWIGREQNKVRVVLGVKTTEVKWGEEWGTIIVWVLIRLIRYDNLWDSEATVLLVCVPFPLKHSGTDTNAGHLCSGHVHTSTSKNSTASANYKFIAERVK